MFRTILFILYNITYFTKYFLCVISFYEYNSAKEIKVKSDIGFRMRNQ